jgi:hypothetical protein
MIVDTECVFFGVLKVIESLVLAFLEIIELVFHRVLAIFIVLGVILLVFGQGSIIDRLTTLGNLAYVCAALFGFGVLARILDY